MNWEAIGAIGEVAGGLAVILSLLYVGRQIQMSLKLARANTERELSSEWNQYISQLTSNEQFVNVFAKGMNDFYSLNESEKIQFASYIGQLTSHHASTLNMKRHGLVEDMESVDQSILGILKSPGGESWWGEYKTLYDKDYRLYLDKLLESETIKPWLDTDYMKGTAAAPSLPNHELP